MDRRWRGVGLGLALVMVCCLFSTPARAQGWLSDFFEPVEHTHFSPLGTPYVHPFTMEPPQIHQDAFFIFRHTSNTIEGTDENEAEAHLDWAISKRLGIVIGVPFLGVVDAAGNHSQGFGDLEIAPRVVWIQRDSFILSSNFFITIPTGDASRDLGAGETLLAPFITTWHDLGNWNTLLLNFGPEIGTISGDTSMIYGFSLTHSVLKRALLQADEHDHEDYEQRHFEPGMTTFYLEMQGETEMSGLNRTFIEVLPGISYVLAEHAELRFGVLLPVSSLQRFDSQYNFSFTWIY